MGSLRQAQGDRGYKLSPNGLKKRLINLDVLVEEGTVSPEDLKLFSYADDPQAAWECIVRFYELPTNPIDKQAAS